MNISDSEKRIVLDIIGDLAPDCDVLAFGSRYRRNSKPYSDFDLAFLPANGEKLGLKRSGRLELAFSESDLPYRVDVVDYHTASAEFKNIIDNGNERIHSAHEN
ncbi:MAG: nucleotidyltransferase domain-containing protein [Oscillospiraceae bacterium]|jgi:predicted nucleotidyltransferase|nr:nucleotidyltransferase domain-containing protein [Oscillospiraceae bacterium]